MVLHPIILVPKLIAAILLIVLLVILHGVLAPDQFRAAVVVAVAAFVVFIIVLWVVAYRMVKNPDSRLAKALTLPVPPRADGRQAAGGAAAAPGATGRAASALRPSGTAVIDGKRMPVITDGEFIAAGAAIEVAEVSGGKVIVREASQLPIGQGPAPS